MSSEAAVQNPQQKTPFLKAEQILPPQICKSLSHRAKRLYASAWHQAHRRGVGEVWIRESDFDRFASLNQFEVDSAKAELVAARLIRWQHGLTQTKFTFVDPDADEFAMIFREPTE
jgi:hypothetical protein